MVKFNKDTLTTEIVKKMLEGDCLHLIGMTLKEALAFLGEDSNDSPEETTEQEPKKEEKSVEPKSEPEVEEKADSEVTETEEDTTDE